VITQGADKRPLALILPLQAGPGVKTGLATEKKNSRAAEHGLRFPQQSSIQYTGMAKTKISALLHVCDNQNSLGRALDSLRPCDEVIVVDHGSKDETVKVAREHGARVITAVPGVDRGAYAQDAHNQWILCLLPEEALAEELEASLFEWREAEHEDGQLGFGIMIREQNGAGWKSLPAEMRLANRKQINWTGDLPPANPEAPALAGHILRIPEDHG
jgi:hypothetical protein